MMSIQDIKEMLSRGESERVIQVVNELSGTGSLTGRSLAMAYYLRGNAYRQQGKFGDAMNSYLQAIELDPDGPAVQAYRSAQMILDYYHHDYYNP